MGTSTRNRERVRGTADLRIPSLDHVFAQGVLLLRSAEEESSGGVVLSGPDCKVADGAEDDAILTNQSCASGPDHPQGPGGVTAHRLAQRSFRRFRRIERKTQKEARKKEIREEEVVDH